jgi:two-component system chemotaxis response regulator CheY
MVFPYKSTMRWEHLMKTVLIIDDSTIMRMIIRNTVTKHGFYVVGEANNGRAGVEKFKELNPDLVTMDVTMKEVSGIEALRQIKKISADAKVIMVSAMGQELIVRDAIVAGARGFIVKPFNEEQLIEALKKI